MGHSRPFHYTPWQGKQPLDQAAAAVALYQHVAALKKQLLGVSPVHEVGIPFRCREFMLARDGVCCGKHSPDYPLDFNTKANFPHRRTICPLRSDSCLYSCPCNASSL